MLGSILRAAKSVAKTAAKYGTKDAKTSVTLAKKEANSNATAKEETKLAAQAVALAERTQIPASLTSASAPNAPSLAPVGIGIVTPLTGGRGT